MSKSAFIDIEEYTDIGEAIAEFTGVHWDYEECRTERIHGLHRRTYELYTNDNEFVAVVTVDQYLNSDNEMVTELTLV